MEFEWGALHANAAEKAKKRPTKPTTKAHPLDLRLSVSVAHSLVFTGVPVLEASSAAAVVSSGDE